MLVLNLRCDGGHLFEGWFGSNSDFESQQTRHLLSCPICSTTQIARMPSAPRIHTLRGQSEQQLDVNSRATSAAEPLPNRGGATVAVNDVKAIQAHLLHAVRQVLANTEDVGVKFAEEARKIHYGESEQRGIRGHATVEESKALADEGIEVMSLPLPEVFKSTLQ